MCLASRAKKGLKNACEPCANLEALSAQNDLWPRVPATRHAASSVWIDRSGQSHAYFLDMHQAPLSLTRTNTDTFAYSVVHTISVHSRDITTKPMFAPSVCDTAWFKGWINNPYRDGLDSVQTVKALNTHTESLQHSARSRC